MLAKPQKQKLCKSATPLRILVAAGSERQFMNITLMKLPDSGYFHRCPSLDASGLVLLIVVTR